MILDLFAESTTVVQLNDLSNRGDPVTDASVQVIGITALDGTEVSPDDFPISMPYSASLELYEGTIPHTIGIEAGRTYLVKVRADDGGIVRTWECRTLAQSC